MHIQSEKKEAEKCFPYRESFKKSAISAFNEIVQITTTTQNFSASTPCAPSASAWGPVKASSRGNNSTFHLPIARVTCWMVTLRTASEGTRCPWRSWFQSFWWESCRRSFTCTTRTLSWKKSLAGELSELCTRCVNVFVHLYLCSVAQGVSVFLSTCTPVVWLNSMHTVCQCPCLPVLV